jgi:hypothetical protein
MLIIEDFLYVYKYKIFMCSPIFAEIVPERSRASIYALDRSFESVLASFAPPVVGFLAEHAYGYTPHFIWGWSEQCCEG